MASVVKALAQFFKNSPASLAQELKILLLEQYIKRIPPKNKAIPGVSRTDFTYVDDYISWTDWCSMNNYITYFIIINLISIL